MLQTQTWKKKGLLSDAARKLLIERELWLRRCRRELPAWCIEAQRGEEFLPARHHAFLLSVIDEVINGDIDRAMIFMPPGSAKSRYLSQLTPPYALMRHPRWNIIGASHTGALAESFSRKVMGYIDDNQHVLNYGLANRTPDRWRTTKGGEYLAAGVGGAIPGYRADLIIIDDPIKGRIAAENEQARDALWSWFWGDVRHRLRPRGRIILMHCMTGDTPVTMADGTRKPLERVRPGDMVLSWKNGAVQACRVLNWAPQGEDDVFEIRTGSSKVRANARHPFLVQRSSGSAEWVKVRDLVAGDRLVTSSRILGRSGGRLDQIRAWLLGYMFGDGWVTTRDTIQRGYKGRSYPRRGFVTCVAHAVDPVENERVAAAFGQIFKCRPKPTRYGYSRIDIAAVGRWFSEHGLIGKARAKRLPTWLYSEPEEIRLAFLEGFNQADGHICSKGANIGRWGFGSSSEMLIDDIRHLGRGVGYRVTNNYVYRGMAQPPNSPAPVALTIANVQWGSKRQSEDFCSQAIRLIRPAGRAPVFDIQVEDAECFFADGLVSHNTRWHEDDLAGRLLATQGDRWKVFNLPAMAMENDPIGRAPGDWLWDDVGDPYGYGRELADKLEELRTVGAMREWNSQYQQRPSAPDGSLFKVNKLEYLDDPTDIPKGTAIVRAWDLAATKQVGTNDPDFTVGIKLGRTPKDEFLILDAVALRGGPDEVEEAIVSTAKADGRNVRVGIPQDPGQAGKSQVVYFTRKLIGYRTDSSPESGDKATRAGPVAAQCNVGNIRMLRGPWNARMKEEMAAFPSGRHDDHIDALSRAFMMLDSNTLTVWRRAAGMA